MSYRIHPWLLALCDPEGFDELPTSRLNLAEWKQLLTLASEHGVRAAVVQNLKTLVGQQASDRLVKAADPRVNTAAQLVKTADASDLMWAVIEDAQNECRRELAYTLLLRARAAELVRKFRSEGYFAAIVKGEDFADRLYPGAHLRTFRDIDLMMPFSTIDEVQSIMIAQGYRAVLPSGKYSVAYGERTWDSVSEPRVRVELHWNMITCPSQRLVSSLAYDDLDWERTSEGLRATAESMLLIAAVHAAVSHRFDRLQHLVDVRQICRGRANALDLHRLRELASRHRLMNVLCGVLQLTAKLLPDPACRQLLAELGGEVPKQLLWRLLVNGKVLLEPNTRWNKLRRGLLREWMKRAA